jgi:anti-sigma factor RsiW
MPNCQTIDPLVTPYVDGQLPDADRDIVERHLRTCPPCDSRVAAERAVHELIRARRDELESPCASRVLHSKCAAIADSTRTPTSASAGWRARLAPLAVAASLVLIVGAAFLYQLTASSSRVMAAELAADHLKCFAMNDVLHTHQEAATVESAMLSGFGWRMQMPSNISREGLELVGSRPCMYGEGKIAHIMYLHHGEPVSLFMLPRSSRAKELVQVLGHKAAIWCENDRTFVLVAREPKEDVERMAALVQSSLR